MGSFTAARRTCAASADAKLSTASEIPIDSVCPTILPFSGGRDRERSDRRARPNCNGQLDGTVSPAFMAPRPLVGPCDKVLAIEFNHRVHEEPCRMTIVVGIIHVEGDQHSGLQLDSK